MIFYLIHGFLGLSWYIQTNAIGIVILNKKIPINQKAGICSPNKRKGNDKINDRLAAGRADAIVNALKTQYGISESRISFDSKGSRVQPFADNDMNRVSICIAE